MKKEQVNIVISNENEKEMKGKWGSEKEKKIDIDKNCIRYNVK